MSKRRDEGVAAMIAERIAGERDLIVSHAYWCVECKGWWFTNERGSDNVQEWTCKDCDMRTVGEVRGSEFIRGVPA